MKALILSLSMAALTLPAFAQTSDTNTTTGQSSTTGQTDTAATGTTAMGTQDRVSVDRLRQTLSSAGFQDVQILDASFLVQATTEDGNMVLMVINPPMRGQAGMMGSGSSSTTGDTGTGTGTGTGSSDN